MHFQAPRFLRILQAQRRVMNQYSLCAMVGRRVQQLTQNGSVRSVSEAIGQALEEIGTGQLTLLDPALAEQTQKRKKAERSGAEASAERMPRQAAQVEA